MSVLNWVICIQRSSIFQIPSGLPFRFGYFFKPCPHAAAPSSPAVHTVSREPCTRVQDETPPAFLPPSQALTSQRGKAMATREKLLLFHILPFTDWVTFCQQPLKQPLEIFRIASTWLLCLPR